MNKYLGSVGLKNTSKWVIITKTYTMYEIEIKNVLFLVAY